MLKTTKFGVLPSLHIISLIFKSATFLCKQEFFELNLGDEESRWDQRRSHRYLLRSSVSNLWLVKCENIFDLFKGLSYSASQDVDEE